MKSILLLLFCIGLSMAQTVVRLNQVGYLPNAPKHFEIPVQRGVADSFTVQRLSGQAVFKGALRQAALDEASAENLRRGDFSNVKDTGCFQLRIGTHTSPAFRISEHLYDRLAFDAANAFHLIRANVALNDTIGGVHVFHAVAHQQDSSLLGRDLRGGWYNAGDYGKWTHEAAFSIANMLWLYEYKPGIANNIKGFLDEIRWGLDWLFKMQTDSGAVLHKVDTEGCWGWGKGPDADTCTRQASFQEKGNMKPSTVDAAALSAVMAQAYRSFKTVDKPLAQRCSTAATLSWEWVQRNLTEGQRDPYYTLNSPAPMVTWAAGEIYTLNGDLEALALFRKNFAGAAPNEPTWANPEFFGYLALANSKITPKPLRDSVSKSIAASSSNFMEQSKESGFGQALSTADYYWGSNAHVLGKAMVMIADYEINKNKQARATALSQLDYLLGRNALGISMVTGYGSLRTMQPYHWIYKAYDAIMPGWVSGGPNSYPSGADDALSTLINAGTPAAKCWLDTISSYASNEGSTDENALLLFVAGYFAADEFAMHPAGKAINLKEAINSRRSREPRREKMDESNCFTDKFDILLQRNVR